AAVLDSQRVRVDHVPGPAEGRGLAAEQIRETELLAMRRIAEDGETPPPGRSPPAPGRGEGATKAGTRAAVRSAACRPDLLRRPDLALTGGLVAVVFERGEGPRPPPHTVQAAP